ncbi:MAG: peptide chain release factor N(5)-glutamine methyltransferase [Pseudomonadota bacterium]
MSTVGQLLLSATRRLAQSPSAADTPRLDAELLIMRLLGVDRAWLYAHPEAALPAAVAAAFDTLVDARERGMPVAYLVGEREFFSRPFRVTPDTLIPRPDTERLVDAVLQLKLPERARVLDLGTGTGALAVTLALECPDWDVTATDIHDATLAVARDNAARLGACVRFAAGDWFAALPPGDRFDLVVSNPPYIAADDPHLAQGDVRFEPRRALVAADQGLADIARIVNDARGRLHDGGWLIVEHGWTQADAVCDLARAAGYAPVRTLLDLAGRPRALLAGWQQPDNPEDAHHA